MPINLQQDILHRLNGNVTSVAPLREGALAATPENKENGVGFIGQGLSGLNGFRIEFAATDFSARQYLTFQLASNAYDSMRRLDTVANGGLRFLIEDANGNWSRWNIHGKEIDSSPNKLGVFKAFAEVIGSSNRPDGSPVWYIDKASTPNAVSGSIDYSNIVAVEVTANMLQTGEFAMYIGLLGVASRPVATGGNAFNPVTFNDFWAGYNFADSIGGNGFRTPRMFFRPSAMMGGANTVQTTCQHGFEIGNGVDQTYFKDSNFELAFYPSQRTILNAPLKGFGVGVIDTDLPRRDGIINLEPGGVCDWDVFSITGRVGDYRILNIGARAVLGTGRIFGAYDVLAQNLEGNIAFNRCNTVTVDETTVFSGGGLFDQPEEGKGLYVVGGPATYHNLNITCEEKITIKADVAGLYSLPNVTSTKTINVHNESLINAIDVALPEGVAATATTAGGAITILQPDIALSIDLPLGVSGVFVIHDLDSVNTDNLGTELQRNNNASGRQVFNYNSAKIGDLINIQFIANGFVRYLEPYTLTANNGLLVVRLDIQSNR